jgi:hypothetical protein
MDYGSQSNFSSIDRKERAIRLARVYAYILSLGIAVDDNTGINTEDQNHVVSKEDE